MLRNSNDGIYQVKRGYRKDIAKYANVSVERIKNILHRLKTKGLITNNPGANLGVYTFHPAIQALQPNHESIAFKFVNS